MQDYKALEFEWADINKDIQRAYSIGNYTLTAHLIQKAMPIVEKLYKEAYEPAKKEIMKQNAVKLKNLYAKCANASEEVIPIGGSKPVSKPKPNNQVRPSKPGEKSKKEEDTIEGLEGVNFDILGVDVKQFLITESNDPVSFEDVKGMEEEKKLISREFFLTAEQRAYAESLGKKPKQFILLYGVPGTGKTFFAKAIATELKNRLGKDENIPFFSVVGSQLKDSKVGQSEKNIQALFEFCKQFEHCVLFIDEFEAIVPDRKQATGDPTAASTVTTFIQMMDGFSSSKGTLVIGATNCPYNMDGAVLSRANTRIEIPLPSYEVVYGTLQAKLKNNLVLESNISMEELAKEIVRRRYSNRDIKNILENYRDSLADHFIETNESIKINKEIIQNAFVKIVPTTKQSDIDRINLFKIKGE